MNSLSIVVPIYNKEDYLEQCILSILNEIELTDELILINDGSTDSSLSICRKYESENVTVINNTNHGVSYSRNCGIENAKCDYINFVDSDDYLIPGWRNILEKGMETRKDIVYFSESNNLVPNKKEIILDTVGFRTNQPITFNTSACWNKLFCRRFILENKILFEVGLINGEDGLFCLDAIIKTKSYTIVQDQKFYFYRINPNSTTHTFNERFNDSNRKYLILVDKCLQESDLFTISEIKSIITFLNIQGLYLLTYRISKIEDVESRKNKYYLFDQPEYT